jgi:hypothetical protein
LAASVTYLNIRWASAGFRYRSREKFSKPRMYRATPCGPRYHSGNSTLNSGPASSFTLRQKGMTMARYGLRSKSKLPGSSVCSSTIGSLAKVGSSPWVNSTFCPSIPASWVTPKHTGMSRVSGVSSAKRRNFSRRILKWYSRK